MMEENSENEIPNDSFENEKLNSSSAAKTKGLNIFYYGFGKGKTTAAMGLAVRAAGAGMNVYVLQFVKAKRPKEGEQRQSGEWPVSSEILFFEEWERLREQVSAAAGLKVGSIENEQVGLGFVGILGDKKEMQQHVEQARAGIRRALEIFESGKYQLVVLDELVSALEVGLLSEDEILQLIAAKPEKMHLAYTGHDAFKRIIDASDMVSEIDMIKHPYYKGILAQRGIDF